MARRTALLPALIAGVVLACTAAVLAAPAREAGAAFPGENGRIAFSSDRDGGFDIYTMAPDGTDVRRLTSNGRFDGFPAYSPDGRKIAYTGKGKGERNRDIYVMKANGTDVRKLTDDNALDQDPSWSPDGRRIAFVSNRAPSPTGAINRDVYTMNADGTGVRRLTDDPAPDNSPAFSPDGTEIVFDSPRDNGDTSPDPIPDPDLYLMNADGSGEQPIPYDGREHGFQSQPSWSPEGARLAFRCAGRLCVGDAHGSTRRVISDSFPSTDYQPAFAPDGTRIAFVSDRDGNPEIYATDADGSDQARLTASPSVDRQPDWRPVPDPRPVPAPGPISDPRR